MENDNDIILVEGSHIKDLLDIIDMQLIVINSVSDLDITIYDDLAEHRVKVMVRSMKLIAKVQDIIIKDL